MPIQFQSNQNIPYLINYSPITFSNQIEVLDINDMVSVNIPTELLSGNINYDIGSNFNPTYTVSVTNLTSNASLNVIFYFSNKVLYNLESVSIGTISQVKKTVSPSDTINVDFTLNKISLDSSANYEIYDFNFSIKITNIENGYIVLKNL